MKEGRVMVKFVALINVPKLKSCYQMAHVRSVRHIQELKAMEDGVDLMNVIHDKNF